MIYWLHHQWNSLVATIHFRVRMQGRTRGRAQGVRTPPPPSDDMLFSKTTGILQKKKTMWFIGVEVDQETSAPPPDKNPGSAPGMSARSRLGCFRAKLVCWAGRGEEGVPKPLKPSPNYAPKYYATRSSKNLLSWLKIFLLVVLPYAVVLFDFDYFGECIFYYYYSRQITHFWSKFLSPTRSLRLYLSQYFCGVTES